MATLESTFNYTFKLDDHELAVVLDALLMAQKKTKPAQPLANDAAKLVDIIGDVLANHGCCK